MRNSGTREGNVGQCSTFFVYLDGLAYSEVNLTASSSEKKITKKPHNSEVKAIPELIS